MATIPTLIVAPAIVAAGIAYRYTGGGEASSSDARNGGPASAAMPGRRRSETDRVGAAGDVYSAPIASERWSLGTRFEQDFQPRVPMQRQLADPSFIPTNMLGGTVLQAQAAGALGGGGAPGDQRRSSSSSLPSHMSLYGMSGGPTELAPGNSGRYPRTTDEIEHTSWLQRTARSITGDLGPIEHQEAVVGVEATGDSQQSAAGRREGAPQFSIRDSAKDIRDRSVHDAARAAEDVTAHLPRDDDANKAAQNVTRSDIDGIGAGLDQAKQTIKQAADETRGWFRSKKKEINDSAAKTAADVDRMASDAVDSTKQAFDETQGWFWTKKKEVDDAAAKTVDDANRMASEVSESAKEAANKTRGWFWSKKKEVDDSAAKAAADADRMANDISDSTKQAYDETQGWFWTKKKEIDDAAAKTVDEANRMASEVSESAKGAAADVDRMANDISESTKQAFDETQGWFWSQSQEAGNAARDAKRRASDVTDSARLAAGEARDKLASKKQEAGEAAASTAQDIKRRASDASDSAKQAADSTWSWLWSRKKEVDDAAANAVDAAKDQAQSARDSVAAKSQQAKDAASDAAETASDWVAAKKQGANEAVANAAETASDTADSARDWLREKQSRARDSARESASSARDWAEDTKDDIANSVGRADDVTRAWMWDKKGQIDQAIADSAGAVQQSADAASNRALEEADSASRSYWQRGLGTGITAGWKKPSSAETNPVDSPSKSQQQEQQQRRDSLLSSTDDNSVIHALDEKFNEARSILRSTTDDIKTMASDASSAATETLRSAAEKTLPRPSDDGINMGEAYDSRHNDQAQFVELNSHIPLLSSSPHRRT
ncbi:hypothetical protein IWW47_000335 [Coemansia sp. RSA 2052]|nr:hypothetical protein IWW47_000335 [Coemansia sp. RSA 2052]